MALSRCLAHHSPPRSHRYVCYAYPCGHPNSSTICGIPGCNEQGVVWLDDEEQTVYSSGQRILPGPNNNFTKMRVDDRGTFTICHVS